MTTKSMGDIMVLYPINTISFNNDSNILQITNIYHGSLSITTIKSKKVKEQF